MYTRISVIIQGAKGTIERDKLYCSFSNPGFPMELIHMACNVCVVRAAYSNGMGCQKRA